MITRRSVLTSSLAAAATVGVWGGGAVAPAFCSPLRRRVQPVAFVTGGSFPGSPEHPQVFGRYMLSLTSAQLPKICFLGAASGDCPSAVESFRDLMRGLPNETTGFNIFEPPTLDFLDYLMGFDIVFVGGGSTRNLLALWREWGFDKAMIEAWRAGVVMAGGSAGALCWYEGGLSDSYPRQLSPVKGLGVLQGSADVHHHNRPDRQTQFRRFIADGSLPSPGLALDEAVGALYRGTTLVELVSASTNAGAWRISRTPSGYDEQRLPVRTLVDRPWPEALRSSSAEPNRPNGVVGLAEDPATVRNRNGSHDKKGSLLGGGPAS